MKKRNRVLAMVCGLMTILMLDRVCLSVAGPRMQAALHIGPAAWGWVNAVFAIAFACFEIPIGALGDRIGPRKVLTRIVIWWSAFTALTGAVVRLPVLLAVRFFFGLGEAGGYPMPPSSLRDGFHSANAAAPLALCSARLSLAARSRRSSSSRSWRDSDGVRAFGAWAR